MAIVRQFAIDDCCCDGSGGKRPLIPVDDALSLVRSAVRTIDRVETVTLDNAAGRILAEPVHARASVPPFDNAAMDGYAVRARDFAGEGPWSFPVAGSVAAGHAFGARLPAASVMQILTGAPVPNGADSVIPQENVVVGDGHVVFPVRPKPGCHVRYSGEDLDAGQLVAPAGCVLGGAEVAALAGAGHAGVPVRSAIRVAVISTGDELRRSGEPLSGASIWDVNTPMLRAALRAAGAELVEAASVIDDRAAMADEFRRLAPDCDLIVTSGGVSVGDKDFVKPALSDAGGRIVFSGVAMKPGKPVSFGRIGQTSWLGLPGNPYAALVTWTLFGRRLLDSMLGVPDPASPAIPVVATTRQPRPKGRSEFRLATIMGFDALGRMQVQCAAATHSARVSGLPDADGIVEIPHDAEKTVPNGLLRFFPI